MSCMLRYHRTQNGLKKSCKSKTFSAAVILYKLYPCYSSQTLHIRKLLSAILIVEQIGGSRRFYRWTLGNSSCHKKGGLCSGRWLLYNGANISSLYSTNQFPRICPSACFDLTIWSMSIRRCPSLLHDFVKSSSIRLPLLSVVFPPRCLFCTSESSNVQHSASFKILMISRHLLRTSAYPSNTVIRDELLPLNESTLSLSHGLMRAHSCYGSSKSSTTLPLCIAFIVQLPERNAFDQRHLEYDLQSTHEISVFRIPFGSVISDTHIPVENPRRPLIYRPPHSPSDPYEVSTVYFRAGYGPSEYSSSELWMARLHLERSAAIKCPSILTHLAGCKKVQQVLATPSSSHITRLLPNSNMADRVRATFAAIYPMDDSPAGLKAKAIAVDPEKSRGYVLKPQREGGGNNIYRSAIPPFLRNLGNEKNWRGHILMEIIEPPNLTNSIFREGSVNTGPVIGELGVYGVALWQNGHTSEEHAGRNGNSQIIENFQAGYLLRTKGKDSDEGGVAAGFGSVDSVCLTDT